MEKEEHETPLLTKEDVTYGSNTSPQINTETNNEKVDIDEAFTYIGTTGRFQTILHILLAYLVLTFGYHFVLALFIGDDPPWECIARNSSEFCRKHFGHVIAKDNKMFYQRCELNRSEWAYTTLKSYTFLTEFDLVCKHTSVAALTSASFYIGGLAGSLVSGTLADTFGRKIVIVVSLFATICFSIGCAFTTSVLQLSILRGVLGAAHVACYFTGFVYLLEFSAPEHRPFSANMYVFSLTLSMLVIDLFAYFERRWRYLQIYATFPCMLALVLLLFIPESPRWLLATKQHARAQNVLQYIARMNSRPPLSVQLKELPYEKKYSYLDLLMNVKIVILCIAIGLLWTTIALVYYTIALESSSLGGDMYRTFALLTLADIPSYFVSYYMLNRCGRKKTTLVSLAMGGVFVGLMAVVPQTLNYKHYILMTLITLSKMLTEVSFNGVYCWTVELYPTVLRSQGTSICVVFERLGLIAVPFLTTVLQSLSYQLPFVFMGCLAILSSVVGLVLPETNKKPTREKYEDLFEEEGVMDYHKIADAETRH